MTVHIALLNSCLLAPTSIQSKACRRAYFRLHQSAMQWQTTRRSAAHSRLSYAAAWSSLSLFCSCLPSNVTHPAQRVCCRPHIQLRPPRVALQGKQCHRACIQQEKVQSTPTASQCLFSRAQTGPAHEQAKTSTSTTPYAGSWPAAFFTPLHASRCPWYQAALWHLGEQYLPGHMRQRSSD